MAKGAWKFSPEENKKTDNSDLPMRKIVIILVLIGGLAFWMTSGPKQAVKYEVKYSTRPQQITVTRGPATLKGEYPICVTEDLLDQAHTASANKDRRLWDYVMSNGCVIAQEGIKVSVLE